MLSSHSACFCDEGFINKSESTSLIVTMQKTKCVIGRTIDFLWECVKSRTRASPSPPGLHSHPSFSIHFNISVFLPVKYYYDFKALIPNQFRRYVMADAGSFTCPILASGPSWVQFLMSTNQIKYSIKYFKYSPPAVLRHAYRGIIIHACIRTDVNYPSLVTIKSNRFDCSLHQLPVERGEKHYWVLLTAHPSDATEHIIAGGASKAFCSI